MREAPTQRWTDNAAMRLLQLRHLATVTSIIIIITIIVAIIIFSRPDAYSSHTRSFLSEVCVNILQYVLSGGRGWLGSRVVSVLDSGAEGPGFKSQPRRCQVTVVGKLFTPIVSLFTEQRNW